MTPNHPQKFTQNLSEEQEPNKSQLQDRYLDVCMSDIRQKSKFIDSPRQIPKKSYSLAPDMATGWRPKNKNVVNFQNVFPLNFKNCILDQIVKVLSRKNKYKFGLAYLGPRKLNSYLLHEDRQYTNPYPFQKKIQTFTSERPGINLRTLQLENQPLQFNSDFQSGNLDIAVKIQNENLQSSLLEYDLFMRVDTNTKGHTNWYYFQIKTKLQWVGSVKFNICNFRRPKSLYQRGMKPYIWSKKQNKDSELTHAAWKQGGRCVTYDRKPLRYKFLYDDDDDYSILETYYTLSFTFDFDVPANVLRFAYCVPYSYSELLTLVKQISCLPVVKYQTAWRSLSGVPVPLIQITNFEEPDYNKKVILVTARIHPGQSNSSHVCDGLIRSLIFDEKSQQFLKKSHFFIIPMLNPDGVIAGNYRTSLFGRDLNRTFNQSRKYAFPETFHLVNFASKLKKQHKQRFNIYLDLHGHSVKKNIFFYGPDYNIAHGFYNQSRDFPRILGNLTSMFRYYSCIFRISSEKATTARATFNRSVKIPFTYTLQSSNGAFYDSSEHQQKNFISTKWSQMGKHLVKGLQLWIHRLQKKNIFSSSKKKTKFIADSSSESEVDQNDLSKKQPPGKQKQSDDEISEGKSDSEPESEDLDDEELKNLENQIQGRVKTQEKQKKASPMTKNRLSPEKSFRIKNKAQNFDWSQNLRGSNNSTYKAISPVRRQRLPPINLQVNQVQFLANHSRKKRMIISEALNNLTRGELKQDNHTNSAYKKKPSNSRLSISQILNDQKQKQIKIEQKNLVLKKKLSRQELQFNVKTNL